MIRATDIPLVSRFRMRLHYTWLAAFILIAAVIVTQFPESYPLWHRIILGIAAGLFYFVALVLREFIIIFVAISRGVRVKVVTLFPFGGVPEIARDTALPNIERLLVVVGLLANLLIAGVFYGIHLIMAKNGDIVLTGLMQWLTFIFFLLALLHFVPGFPLDGGRLLQSILWQVTGDYYRARRFASWIGWSIGVLFILGGVYLLVQSSQWFNGLTLALVGWSLENAAKYSRRQAELRESLQGVKAGDIMVRDCSPITRELGLDKLARDCILVTMQQYFIIVDDGRLLGAMAMRNLKRIPKKRWSYVTVGEVMTPVGKLGIARAEQSSASVLEQMDEARIDYMPVLEGDEVVGIIARDSLIRFGKTRAELGI